MRILYVNVHTSDNAEGEVDVKKFGSERAENKTDTEQNTSGHCYRTTTEPVTQLTSYRTYNYTVSQ